MVWSNFYKKKHYFWGLKVIWSGSSNMQQLQRLMCQGVYLGLGLVKKLELTNINTCIHLILSKIGCVTQNILDMKSK